MIKYVLHRISKSELLLEDVPNGQSMYRVYTKVTFKKSRTHFVSKQFTDLIAKKDFVEQSHNPTSALNTALEKEQQLICSLFDLIQASHHRSFRLAGLSRALNVFMASSPVDLFVGGLRSIIFNELSHTNLKGILEFIDKRKVSDIGSLREFVAYYIDLSRDFNLSYLMRSVLDKADDIMLMLNNRYVRYHKLPDLISDNQLAMELANSEKMEYRLIAAGISEVVKDLLCYMTDQNFIEDEQEEFDNFKEHVVRDWPSNITSGDATTIVHPHMQELALINH